MKKKIIEASELPWYTKVYLKKDFLGWRTVEPIKREDGKINYLSVFFGGKKGLFFLIVVLIITALLYLGITELIADYKLIAENPCDYCKDCFSNFIPGQNGEGIASIP